MPHLLVVDDDSEVRELTGEYLRRQGFEVSLAEDGKAMDQALEKSPPDILVLDVMLPGEDGLSIARRLKASSKLPIIMLSAHGEPVDRIIGLEVGADDYIAKPFNPRELLARVRAILRRLEPVSKVSDASPLRFAEFEVNLKSRSLHKAGEPIRLTRSEFDLLEVFITNPDRTLERDQIIEALGGVEMTPFDRSVDVRVARLRAKIERNPAEPQYLKTVWGKGYMFTTDSGSNAHGE
ncbi:MAG: response regulator [Gammaproteobacteria bacterium]|nr:response regulator [Gammaproteobacteria bacterium]MCY4276315.1 response regulator [Gammaproteobacteria bacterium]MCY4322280.1 response regulator [Gammaproteobacteria bacterium]